MSRYAFIAACLLIGLHGFDRAESGRVRMHDDQLSQEDGEDMETGGNPLQQLIQRIASLDEFKYFEIMGVAEDASAHDIKQAYKALVLKLHPDKVRDDPLAKPAEEAFKRVSAAYEVLGDETKRQDYAATLKSPQGQQRKEYQKRKEAAATPAQEMLSKRARELLQRNKAQDLQQRREAAAMKEKAKRAKKAAELQEKLQARPISPGDGVKVVRGEGEGWFGIVYKVQDNGHLKVCLDNSMSADIVPRLPEPRTVGWGHHTSHCAKVIEAADEDLQETAQSLQRKIESIEKAEEIKRYVDDMMN